MTTERDWLAWHEPYADPDSDLRARLADVQRHLRAALDGAAGRPVRVVSLCAGQGHDVIGVLRDHPRASEVAARLIELDRRNVERARAAASASGVDVELVHGDASDTTACAGAVPADVVLACGIFGNVSDEDVHRTVASLPMLCADGAVVIWTRHRFPPDLTPSIRSWFDEAGFTEVGFDAPEGRLYAVGAHRLHAPPAPFRPGTRLFNFVGFDALAGPR